MAKRKKRVRRAVIWSVVGVVILALIASAVVFRPRKSKYTQVVSKTGDLATYYSFSGTVAAENSQTVYADGAMQIDEIKVTQGQTVKQGDVLMVTKTGQEITAPIGGTVSEIDADTGAPEMGGSTLCRIVDYTDLELDIQVDEYDLSAIAVGKDATVTVNALNKDVAGKVTEVSREGVSQNGVTYFDAKVSLPNESDLRVGMTAQAKVLDKSVKSVTLLPVSSIQFDSDNHPYVYSGGRRNPVKKVSLTLGISDGTNVEVKSGIKSGDTVLVPPSDTSSSFGFGMGRARNNQSSSQGQNNSAGSASGSVTSVGGKG